MPIHFAWWNTLQQAPIEGMSSFSHAIGRSFAEMKDACTRTLQPDIDHCF